MTTIGQLTERLTLQQPSYAADSYGDVNKTTWFDVATIWASVESLAENLSARAAAEVVTSGQVGALNSYRVTIRSRDGITTKHRFAWDDTYLQILGVNKARSGTGYMQLICREAA